MLTAEPPVKWSTVRFSGAELEAQLEKSFARNDAGEMVIKHSGERVEMLVAARVRDQQRGRLASSRGPEGVESTYQEVFNRNSN